MMMSGGMPPTAGGMGVMGVMGGYLGGGREYLEGGGVGVDSSVWVPPFWEDPHLADAHLHDPSIAEAAHMGEPPSMGDVGGGDLMDAFPPHQQHEYMMSSDGVVVKEEENIKDDYFKYKDATYAKYVKDNDYLKEETPCRRLHGLRHLAPPGRCPRESGGGWGRGMGGWMGPSERREALSNWLSPRLSISLHAAPVLSASLPVPLHGPDSGLPSDADLQPTNPKNLVIKRRAEKESAKEDDGRKRRKRRKLMYDTEKQKEK